MSRTAAHKQREADTAVAVRTCMGELVVQRSSRNTVADCPFAIMVALNRSSPALKPGLLLICAPKT